MRTCLALRAFAGALTTVGVLAACGDPLGLPDAAIENRTDTVSLWAASGTSLEKPSAYAVDVRRAIRTDAGGSFDFVFDIDRGGQPQLFPPGAIDLGRTGGILLVTEPFESIEVAPTDGYQDSLAVAVSVGDVAVIRGRQVSCFLNLAFPYYAKLHILAVDMVQRRIDLEILTNVNCGYRGLAPGIPTR